MVVKQADSMAVIHVAQINYTTSGHLETHLFTRNKHTGSRKSRMMWIVWFWHDRMHTNRLFHPGFVEVNGEWRTT